MNVLMISDVYFARINGVSTSIETFRNALHALGIRSTLIAPRYADDDETRPDLIRIASRPVPFDPEDRLMRRADLRALLPRLRTMAFDLVHVQTPFMAHYTGLEIARELGCPCIASYHTFFEEYLFHYLPWLPRALMRATARHFSRTQCNALDAVIVPSRAMADTLLRYGVRTSLHILPTGLPAQQFAPGDGNWFRQRYHIDPDRPLLLFVGRVAHEKNIGLLIEMLTALLSRHANALLLITGEGPALSSLQHQVERAGLEAHVRFLGYLDRRRELLDCYRAADLFVFASRTETQGLVLLEAMAQGTPVVALAEMGTRDILARQAGCRIAPADPALFAGIVSDLLDEPRALARMGEAARAYAHEWDTAAMAQRLLALYETLVRTPLPTPVAGQAGLGKAT